MAAKGGWDENTEYHYQVRTRTLAALPELRDQWSGLITRAQLTVQKQSDNVLIGKLSRPEYAEINGDMPGGWDSFVQEKQLNYKKMALTEKPFAIKLKNGAIKSLIVDGSISNEEANQLKAIVSQLQVDTQAENLINCKYNQLPEHEQSNAVFKTMEDTVTGKCETLYDIATLPPYIVQRHPEYVPMPQLKNSGEFIEIVKTKNFSNCDRSEGYHFGISGQSNFKPNSNQMGDFLSVSIHLGGRLKN